jgi:hypothetical protein
MTVRRPSIPLWVIPLFFTTTLAKGQAAAEYAKHFEALSQLSVAVAEAMPADQYWVQTSS